MSARELKPAPELVITSAESEDEEAMKKSVGSNASKSSSLLKLNQESPQWQSAAASDRQGESDSDNDSELSDGDQFLTRGAFLLTPSNELNMDKASALCEKMNFKGPFSLTKTATGILFRFAEPDDYQLTYKKGFSKVTGNRMYKKIPIPCRPQKTFVVFVLEVPEEIPEEDIRHALYKFQSVVEVSRLGVSPTASNIPTPSTPATPTLNRSEKTGGSGIPTPSPSSPTSEPASSPGGNAPPPVVRVTLASLEECNVLLQNGLDFYGATFFPTEPATSSLVRAGPRKIGASNSRLLEVLGAGGQRVRDLLPVFDASGFAKIPPPASKMVKPR